MNRRGFALLATLWVLVAVTALAGVSLAVAHTGWDTSRNRILLARAEWAREACVEILLARYAQTGSARNVDTVDLGRGTWCRATLDDPAARVDVSTADRQTLEHLVSGVRGQASAVDSILASRGQGKIYSLRQIGVDSATRAKLDELLTTRGTGAIDVNAAPRAVLATLPGISEEAAELVLARRATGRPIRSVDDLAAQLSRSGRASVLQAYADLARVAVFSPPGLVAQAEGGIRGSQLRARATLTLVPVPGRLAVVRRETE